MTYILNFIRKRIVVKLVFLIVFVIVSTSTIFIFYFNNYYSNILKNNMAEDLENIVAFAEESYSSPLWNIDLEAVVGVNKAILRNKIIVALNIYLGDRILLSDKKRYKNVEGAISYLVKPYVISKSSKDIKVVSVNILHTEKKYGRVEIYYSERDMKNQINDLNLMLVISFLFIVLFSSIFLFIGVRSITIKPIFRLINTTQMISLSNDLSIRIKKNSNDELGLLYDEFNYMISQAESRENERSKSEYELKKVRNLLTNVLNSLPSVLISLTPQGKVTLWNNAAVDFFGLAPSEAIDHNFWEITDQLNSFKERFDQFVRDGEVHSYYRESLDLEGGNYYDIFFFPILTDVDFGFVLRIDNVTELEKKEMQLRQAQKMGTLGNLAGGLAHDFNNVLGGILGTVSLLKFKMSRNKELPQGAIEEYINTIQDSGDRAVDMVKQLLTLSQKKQIDLNAIDLNVSVKNVVSICLNTFDKAISIETTYHSNPVIIDADITQIEQTILNLCVNASHAMTFMRPEEDHFGGILKIKLSKINVDDFFKLAHPSVEKSKYWCLTIKDDGIGMSKQTQEKIFEPFFTTKDKSKGSGLGMSMVYNIIRQHNGFIDIYSIEGKGTTFSIYLPVSDSEYQFLSKYDAVEEVVKGEGLVLVVDDEEIMRSMAAEILEESGYETIFAKDGDEGITIFKENSDKIAMVLLDMVMPKLNGKETYKKMIEIDPNVKVLLASGFRQDERVQEILNLGVNGFLQKPYSISQLSKKTYEIINS